MTDVAANAPLKVTIYPQSAAQDTGRLVNANATVPDVPDSPQFWGQNGFSFKSFLDVVNPLQHIPVISSLYQSLTGDIPSSGSSIAGGVLYGGPIGMATSIANEISKTQTGNGISANMLALLQGSSITPVAENVPADGTPLGANQRAAYNAYIRTNDLAS